MIESNLDINEDEGDVSARLRDVLISAEMAMGMLKRTSEFVYFDPETDANKFAWPQIRAQLDLIADATSLVLHNLAVAMDELAIAIPDDWDN